MRRVHLLQPHHANVVDLDLLVGGGHPEAGPAGMEVQVGCVPLVLLEAVDLLARVDVEQLVGFVVGHSGDDTAIGIKSCVSHLIEKLNWNSYMIKKRRLTQPLWPMKEFMNLCFATAHNLTDLSSEAVRILWPSGLKATLRTADV